MADTGLSKVIPGHQAEEELFRILLKLTHESGEFLPLYASLAEENGESGN